MNEKGIMLLPTILLVSLTVPLLFLTLLLANHLHSSGNYPVPKKELSVFKADLKALEYPCFTAEAK